MNGVIVGVVGGDIALLGGAVGNVVETPRAVVGVWQKPGCRAVSEL